MAKKLRKIKRKEARKMALTAVDASYVSSSISENSLDVRNKMTKLRQRSMKRLQNHQSKPSEEAIKKANENYEIVGLSQFLTIK